MQPPTSVRIGAQPLAALLAVLALTLSGCITYPATQLLVVVDSDYRPDELRTIEVRTYEAEDFRASFPDSVPVELRTLQVRTMSVAGVDLPFSFGVVPLRGDDSRRVVIELTAYPRSGARVVVRAITGFVRHEIRRVPMFISRNCEGVVCGADETCDESGQCVPATIAPGPPVVPGEEFADAGPRSDAGLDGGPPRDASIDALATDAFVPPGIDAGLDAALDPDAGMDAYVDLDAFMPDAFVPLGADAPFPDAHVEPPDAFVRPDAWAPDAHLNPDAWMPDAFVPVGLDAPFPDVYTPPPDAYTPPPDAFTPPPDVFTPPDAHMPVDSFLPSSSDASDDLADGTTVEPADAGGSDTGPDAPASPPDASQDAGADDASGGTTRDGSARSEDSSIATCPPTCGPGKP